MQELGEKAHEKTSSKKGVIYARTIGVLRDVEPSQGHDGLFSTISCCRFIRRMLRMHKPVRTRSLNKGP